MAESMCDGSKACAPCAAVKATKGEKFQAPLMQGRGQFTGAALEALQASEAGDMLVWGPASVEAVSEDAKLVRMSAIEKALPNAFRRGLISVLHKDQAVGHYRSLQPLDAARASAGKARKLAEYLMAAYGGAPTGVLDVTPGIVEAFPHLKAYAGTKQFFAGGVIYGDTETARLVQNEIRQGNLNSYSISGMPTDVRVLTVCDEANCKVVDDVHGIDMSAITLGSIQGGEGPFSAKVRNPGAAFITLQQLDVPEAGVVVTIEASAGHETSMSAHPSTTGEGHMSTPPAKKTSAVLLAQAEPHLSKLSAEDRKAVAKLFEQVDENAVPDDLKATLIELARRMDALEQRLAAPAPPAAPAEPKEKPADTEAMVEQAATKAAAKAVDAVKALLAQAKPAETPKPAGSTPAGDDATKHLLEAAQSGDPAALLTAWQNHRKGAA